MSKFQEENRILKADFTLSNDLISYHKRGTVVGFKLSGPFKFFFDIINVRVTFLDA